MALEWWLWLEIKQFVMAITYEARASLLCKQGTEGEVPMTKIILAAVAALAVTIGALAITGAGDDRSSAPTTTTLPLQY
jgi:hypothetical protein